MQLEKIEKQIEMYTYMFESVKRHKDIYSTDLLEVIIFKLYLSLESLNKIADYINTRGYRLTGVQGDRKYRVQDISKIIKEAKGVDPELAAIVRRLFYLNKRGVKEKEWTENGICLSYNGQKR